MPAAETTQETNPAPTAAQEMDALVVTAEATLDRGARVGSGFLGSIGQKLVQLIEGIADFFAPEPPKSRDQAEREIRSAEERAETQAFARDAQEKEATQDHLLTEIRRQQEQNPEADPIMAALAALASPDTEAAREASRERREGHEREYDRDRD
jgi:1,6-anhydro-N-acetylmuramate kinase